MFKNKLLLALLVMFVVAVVVLATKNVSAGDGTGGHMGGIIATFFS